MSLPALPDHKLWSPNVHNARNSLHNIYHAATMAVSGGNLDVHRIQYHQRAITDKAIRILLDLETCSEDEGLPQSWLVRCGERFTSLMVQLAEAENAATGV